VSSEQQTESREQKAMNRAQLPADSSLLTAPSAADIVAAARSYLGSQFRHQGRTRAGVDCAGLIICVAHDCGLYLDYQHVAYGKIFNGAITLRELTTYLDRVAASDLRPGDVALFAGSAAHAHRPDPARHVAIVAGRQQETVSREPSSGSPLPVHGSLTLIHAYAPLGKVIEHRFDDAWRARLHAAFRLRGVTPEGSSCQPRPR
jgi:cell wall-associated NlpC family hydrolase